jgi:hypothetical protein
MDAGGWLNFTHMTNGGVIDSVTGHSVPIIEESLSVMQIGQYSQPSAYHAARRYSDNKWS